MVLKRDNIERIVKNETVVKTMIANGWQEVEQPKKSTRKKSEGAN